jgi:hypothetical protein
MMNQLVQRWMNVQLEQVDVKMVSVELYVQLTTDVLQINHLPVLMVIVPKTWLNVLVNLDVLQQNHSVVLIINVQLNHNYVKIKRDFKVLKILS